MKTSKSRLGANPLDAYLTTGEASEVPAPSDRGSDATPEKKALAGRRDKKIRATLHIPEVLFDEVRDAVVALSGPPMRLTLATFAERAFRAELAKLVKTANGGKTFPRREGELRGGRPIGS